MFFEANAFSATIDISLFKAEKVKQNFTEKNHDSLFEGTKYFRESGFRFKLLEIWPTYFEVGIWFTKIN